MIDRDNRPAEPENYSLGIEVAKRPGSFFMKDEHFHDHREIYYLVSGERIYFIKDQTYHVSSGDLVLVPENVLHKTSGAGKLSQSHERILVNFRKSDIVGLRPDREGEIDRLFNDYPVLRLNPEEKDAVQGILARLLAEQQDKRPGYEEYSRLLLSELLLQLLRLAGGRPERRDQGLAGAAAIKPHREITEAAQYITAHCEERLSLGEIAKRLHISAYYLSHIFPKVTGVTLVAYINRVRIERACELLRETERPITEIAYRVGYQSVTHFGRVFKKAKGISPQSYRRELRLFRQR